MTVTLGVGEAMCHPDAAVDLAEGRDGRLTRLTRQRVAYRRHSGMCRMNERTAERQLQWVLREKFTSY